MSGEPGPWGDHEPLNDGDDRELDDSPSDAARWVVLALGMWLVIIATGLVIYLR